MTMDDATTGIAINLLLRTEMGILALDKRRADGWLGPKQHKDKSDQLHAQLGERVLTIASLFPDAHVLKLSGIARERAIAYAKAEAEDERERSAGRTA